ncbi:glycosyltransferase family 1 protein [Roseiarcaceae bacterium H3SJ34-1]|uniref:glycosyltransferase family 4 protein n=1 Tax=Terripilifer ovatus TaxID=3032367 RepID=UPI003AB9A165|nr:glycosyltransferase family 1 protein [Roseiarcaceae bacterium H3SJ34-1]
MGCPTAHATLAAGVMPAGVFSAEVLSAGILRTAERLPSVFRQTRSPARLRLLIVTDAWRPQINGVARTYEWLARELPWYGVDLHLLTPEGYRVLPMPSYPGIKLALATPRSVAKKIAAANPDIVHIATEGPLGLMARLHCSARGIPFTTCYHTRYPEYISARWPIIRPRWTYAALRWFHNGAMATMTATSGLAAELAARGFSRTVLWRRGTDVDTFANGPAAELDLPRPLFLFAGRLAVEKNLEAFLDLDLPGSKLVAGDGPARDALEQRYPDARFLGELPSVELGAIYRCADVFVFPSRTDTYGLVMAEALAAGTPVACYPSEGARAIFAGEACGVMSEDLREAALSALAIDRAVCRRVGAMHSLEHSARSFIGILETALTDSRVTKRS